MTQTLKFTQNDVQIEIDFQTDETSVFQEARLSKDINVMVKPSDLGEDFPQSKIIQKIFELADQFKTQDEYLQEFVNYAENFLLDRTVEFDGNNLKISGKPALETENYRYAFNANMNCQNSGHL